MFDRFKWWLPHKHEKKKNEAMMAVLNKQREITMDVKDI